MIELKADESVLLGEYRSLKALRHGRLTVEIRDGKAPIMESTKKILLS